MKGRSEQHFLTPLPEAPGAPRASSEKLYVAVFYHILGTIALPFFVEKLYIDGFYNDFQSTKPFFAITSNIPYDMLSIFRKKTKIGSGNK